MIYYFNKIFKRPTDEKGRLLYIDLAKGLCMLLVICSHSGIGVPLFMQIAVPGFFFLSGVFFSNKGLLPTLKAKVLALLVPLFVFNLITEGYLYVETMFLSNQQPVYHWIEILSQFRITGALWFLMTLFWDFVILLLLTSYVRQRYVQAAIVILLTVVGIVVDKSYNYWHIISALLALPFFYLGYMLNDVVRQRSNTKYNIRSMVVGVMVLAMCYLVTKYIYDASFDLSYGVFVGHPVNAYVLAIMSIMGLLLVCYGVSWLPVISFVGEFSLIVLCVHIFYVNALSHVRQALLPDNTLTHWMVFVVVVVLCLVTVPVCDKYLPFLFGKGRKKPFN